MDVNIFLAFTREDNELKELTAKKIETWNKAHSSLGLTFHPYDWLTDSTPETRAEHRDGQFFINKQNIDKCELMFALIINGTGTPGEYEGKYYPCATLYEVDYHRNRGKRACIFLNNDEPRQEHFQFALENGMGLFWGGDEAKFKETIYEKIDQILMQYVMQTPKEPPLSQYEIDILEYALPNSNGRFITNWVKGKFLIGSPAGNANSNKILNQDGDDEASAKYEYAVKSLEKREYIEEIDPSTRRYYHHYKLLLPGRKAIAQILNARTALPKPEDVS